MSNHPTRSLFSTSAVAIALACLWAAAPAAAQPAGPKSFATPQQAAEALVQAAETNDQAALLAIFGPDGKDLVASGDAVDDEDRRSKFAELAKAKMVIAMEGPKTATVVVGPDDWPLPVPIVQAGGKWHFDSKQGRTEILARRIGGNELDAIELLRGYVESQWEYALVARNESGIRQYAQKFLSTPGKHDGLSWWNDDKTPAGPFGEGIAKALAEGYTDKTKPYNGYFFRILTAQGPAAPLGARDYLFKGMMIGGFAALAWPANYEVTGIQTFQVNHDGVVYQKDLGPDTGKIADGIKAYNPDKTWVITDDAP